MSGEKKLTKKLIEAGVVGKTVAQLLQRWGSMTPEEYALVTHKQVVAETMEVFMEELELLIQPEAIERDIVGFDAPVSIVSLKQGE